MPDSQWDVFLSYASPDRPEVERFAQRLENEANLKVFFDEWRMVPGQNFVPALAEAILASKSCAVFLGRNNLGPWQNQEIQGLIERAVRQAAPTGQSAFRVIPVLLPGAVNTDENPATVFLDLRTRVDFRSGGIDDDKAFDSLVAGIRGRAPGRPSVPPSWLTTSVIADVKRPTGLAADDRAMFVADHESGTVSLVAGSAVSKRATGLVKPHHLIVMGDTLVATDTHQDQLVFFDLDLAVRDKAPALGEHRLRRPHGLASNFPGEFYVTDADNHRVLRVRDRAVTAMAGKAGNEAGAEPGEFAVPCGVAVSPDCVYVADTFNHRVQVLTRDLRPVSAFGEFGYGAGQFAYPVAVIASHEWILVADEHNQRLQLWRRDVPRFGVTCISSDLCRGWLGSPFGLSFDQDGHLLVADRKDGQVIRIAFDRMLAALEVPRANARG